MLDASVNYRSANHLITIKATGAADVPNIEFSSKPSLTKEQILSIILFDTEEGAGTNTGNDMMRMMGGTMAKSVLSDVGIQVDHLVLGEGNSLEVGQKLSEKVMAIFDTVFARLKVKYRHRKNLESVISVGAESQSYDIIYTKEF
jgi:translocation and assembly module TamB